MHEWIEQSIVKRLEGVSIGFEDLTNRENQDATCRTMSDETLVSLLTASQWDLVGLTAPFARSR
jgi:hypothetical protein